MKLTKNMIRGIIILVILLVVYHILAFVLPVARNSAFWLGYVFGLIAIFLQLLVLALAFKHGENAKSKFYGMPIAKLGGLYLAVQMALSFLTMLLSPFIPLWLVVVVFLLAFAAFAIGLMAADTARDEIERQDRVLRANVSKMRGLQSLGMSLCRQCEMPQALPELNKLSEALRFSDPVSSPALEETEAELTTCLDELQRAVVESDCSGALGLCKRASSILAERNRLCKLNKVN